MVKFFNIISSDIFMSDFKDKTLCTCDEEHLEDCIRKILSIKECAKKSIELNIKSILKERELQAVYKEVNGNGDDFDYDTFIPDFTLRIEEIDLNKVYAF